MSNFALQLLTDILLAQGFPSEDAGKAAQLALQGSIRAGIIDRRHLATWETQAQIYHLRGKSMRPCDLVLRFGMSRSKVFEAIRRHGKLRRAALSHLDEAG